MRKKRGLGLYLAILGSVISGAVLVSTCSPPPTPTPVPTFTPTPTVTSTPTPEPPTSTPTPAPLSLVVWHDLPDDQAAQLGKEISQFQPSPQAFQIDLQRYEGEPMLERALSGGSIDFDVVLGNAHAVGFMRDKHLIQPVDNLFSTEFLHGLARPGREGVIHESQIWGVPHTLGLQLMLFYNTKLVTTPPADTASLIDTASRLTGSGRYGLGMNSLDPLWLMPWLSAYGGWPTDDQGKPTLNTEPMVRALTFLHGLAYERKVMAAAIDYDTGLNAFKKGQTALWIDGDWVLSSLREAQDVQWGVARLPILAETNLEPACLIAGKYFVIGAHVNGEKLEAARLLIERLVGMESEKRWTESFRVLPSSLAVLNDALVREDPFLRISTAQMLTGRGVGLSGDMQRAMDAMRGPLEDVMSNRIAPAEAARGMQARVDASSVR